MHDIHAVSVAETVPAADSAALEVTDAEPAGVDLDAVALDIEEDATVSDGRELSMYSNGKYIISSYLLFIHPERRYNSLTSGADIYFTDRHRR